ncbi:lytic transglycosylase domain-containing protein [Siccirubricoccus sp. KC 17139]|uniref:Lytic transglycosylase domain-containing protein n=1 Tax=Siccirubricoccus soli TaxID=2899147 RepID=A0ABT1D7C9_9PROT|nr:lytic transglycosylase domain-containing protein [Siccirubricoccus soli]MCO6417160.1 lytic transglycosylase domain-containing protein [Siccirubricoccus soli]MCP2683295.1 lytic transglycosylase domain-containing protein [Siccirubricoccus soli]
MRRRALLALASLPALPPLPALAQGEGGRALGRQAIALANAQRWPEAEAAAASAHPLLAKYVAWLKLQSRSSGAGAAEIISFALGNPDWPGQETLGRRVEEALLAEPDDGLAVQWFAARAPRSLDGYQRLAEALGRAGKATEAAEVLRSGWAESPGDPAAEPAFLGRAAGLLQPEQHWRRFDRLALARDQAGAVRVLPLLAPDRQGIAAARLAYAADRAEADRPDIATFAPTDAALTAERARWLRRRERDAEAAACWDALRATPDAATARAAWPERQIMARKLLRLGEPRTAYAICARHGITAPGESRQEAEFLAGFLALRKLNEPAVAERHFALLGEDSRSVITRARSLYWQGRAAAAQGDATRARQRFAAAAEFPLAFYGQLAGVALGENGTLLARRIAALPQPGSAAGIEAHELAQLCRILAELGEGRRTRTLLLRLEELAPDPAAKAEVVRFAHRLGRPDNAVWVARRAGAAGLMLPREGWPAPYPAPPDAPEPALVHAIARQESNFDPEAVSSSNARGLMQLLPSTAQAVARRLGLRHALPMLTGDPAHNLRLGAAYLDQLLLRFSGALPFAIAGYNAGPGRVDEWLGNYGDPRADGPTMLDWMEQIPFAETRNYVQRVLENLAIYRTQSPATASLDHPMAVWLRDGA